MQPVLFDPLHPDGLKGSQSYVQRDLRGFNAAFFHAFKNLRGEVQTSGGRGYRSAFARIDGLIALPVRRTIGAFNVRRQRHVADAFDERNEVRNRRETNCPFSELSAGKHFRLKLILIAEEQRFANSNLPARVDQALPFIGLL